MGGRCFENRTELLLAVDMYLGDGKEAQEEIKKTYGNPMDAWCVSKVTDFTSVFDASRNPVVATSGFTESLNSWDMSNAVTLKHMFTRATKFNGNIGNWDV